MSEILRLHNPVNLGGGLGFLPKGDIRLGKGERETDPVILKHWLIKAMLSEGKAAVIKLPEEGGGQAKKEPAAPQKPANKTTPKKPPEQEKPAGGEDSGLSSVASTEGGSPPEE
jgi:hypothetical protein